MSSVQLYAELLLNLRQVTLFVFSSSQQIENCALSLSRDGQGISVDSGGQKVDLILPAVVTSLLTHTLQISPDKESSLRLQLDLAAVEALVVHGSTNDVPWTSRELEISSNIKCRRCMATLVGSGSITQWKDLPSENWAEMMDFWHCHKPTEHANGDTTSDAINKKGYAASNRIIAQSRVGLVDLCSFLFFSGDCANVKEDDHNKGSYHNQFVSCAQCGATVGIPDKIAHGLRIYKSSVCVEDTGGHSHADYEHPVESFLCAQLLAIIDAQAVRQFVVHSGGADAIVLWVFTPDLWFSSSIEDGSPERAMKVLYRHIADPQETLQKQGLTMEELFIPTEVYLALESCLGESTALLPHSARKFKEWTVGLLQRFQARTKAS